MRVYAVAKHQNSPQNHSVSKGIVQNSDRLTLILPLYSLPKPLKTHKKHSNGREKREIENIAAKTMSIPTTTSFVHIFS